MQTIWRPADSTQAPDYAVNLNSLNKLYELACPLHYVAQWHCIAGVTQEQTRRKAGAQNFRSNGLEPMTAELPGQSHRLVRSRRRARTVRPHSRATL